MNILINHTYNEDTTDGFLFEEWVKTNPNWLIMSRSHGNMKFSEGVKGVLLNFVRIYRLHPSKIYLTTTPFHNMFLLIMLKLFCRRSEITYHIHDLYPDFFKYAKGYKVYYRLLKYPFKLALGGTSIITISENIKAYIIANYGCKEERIRVIENFANVQFRALEEVGFEKRLLYIGNIGFAHDTTTSYLLKELGYPTVFKLSGVKKYHKKQNSNVVRILEDDFEVIDKRLSIKDLEELVDRSFATVIFLGYGFDDVLFPCKIYSSLARLVPIVFCGPKSSYISKWLELNCLGVHISNFNELRENRNKYVHAINTFNNKNLIKSISL